MRGFRQRSEVDDVIRLVDSRVAALAREGPAPLGVQVPEKRIPVPDGKFAEQVLHRSEQVEHEGRIGADLDEGVRPGETRPGPLDSRPRQGGL